MNYLSYWQNRQKELKTLASFILLEGWFWRQWLKEVLSFWQEPIFVYFVPEGHILRRTREVIDFKKIAGILETKYSGKITPIPRVEPIKLFRLYLVMFLFCIPSERELCRRAHSDLAIRWFCGFGLLGKIPHHSTLSRFRTRLGKETFLKVFEYIVYCCIKANLVKGDHISIDGSKLPANAKRIPPAEQATRLTEEFLRRLFGTEIVEAETKEQEEELKKIEKEAAKLVGYPLKEPGKILEKIKKKAKEKGAKLIKISKIPIQKTREIKEKLSEVLSEIPHAIGDLKARIGRTSSNENYCGSFVSCL